MRRRDLLTAAGASRAALAAPRIGRAERPNKLVFVPTQDLGVLDPVVTGIRATRNHAYLVSTPSTASIRARQPSLRWSTGIRSRRTGRPGL